MRVKDTAQGLLRSTSGRLLTLLAAHIPARHARSVRSAANVPRTSNRDKRCRERTISTAALLTRCRRPVCADKLPHATGRHMRRLQEDRLVLGSIL